MTLCMIKTEISMTRVRDEHYKSELQQCGEVPEYTELHLGVQPAKCIPHGSRMGTDDWQYIHYRSKVWGHPDNCLFSMKTHTFVYQMSCKMNRKYSHDIDKVRNNDFYLKY